jgi:hypothetical protein
MLPNDYAAAGHEHAEEVDFVMFPAAVAVQFAAIRIPLAAAIVLVQRDEPDAVLLAQALMKRIAVASAVANHSLWFGSRGAPLDGVQESRSANL